MKKRLLLEKRYYLNDSNCKFISVGIIPASRLLSNEASGFYVDVRIASSGYSTPFILGSLDGFLTCFQIIRTFDEFKTHSPNSVGNYDEIDTEVPLNIFKKKLQGGSFLYIIANGYNQSITLGSVTVQDILKYESLIAGAIRKLSSMTPAIERQFNDLVVRSTEDMDAVMTEAARSGDFTAVEILSYFNDVYKACVDQKAKDNTRPSRAAYLMH